MTFTMVRLGKDKLQETVWSGSLRYKTLFINNFLINNERREKLNLLEVQNIKINIKVGNKIGIDCVKINIYLF